MASYSDDFSGTLGAWTSDSGTWTITSGTLRQTSTSGVYRKLRYSSAMDGQNHYSQATVQNNADTDGVAVFTRGTVGSAVTYYGYIFFGNDASYIVEITAGSESILATGGSYTSGTVVARLTADGSSLTGTRGGSADVSTTDSTLTGLATGCACYGDLNSASKNWDLWSAADLSSSIVVSPTAANAGTDAIAPTVVLGSVSITPAAADADTVTIDPTVAIAGGGVSVTPDPAEATAVTIDPTVALSPVVVAPAAATAGATSKVNGTRLRFRGYLGVSESKARLPLQPGGVNSPINVGGNFTVEFDIQCNYADNTATDPDARYTNIIVDHDVWGQPEGWVIGVRRVSGTLRVCFGSAANSWATITGSTSVGDGVRHRVAVTRNQSSGLVTIWVDGVSDASGTYDTGDWSYTTDPGTGTNNEYLVLGGEKHGVGVAYTGYLDELRISNTVRYSSGYTVADGEFEPDANTMGLYHFNEGSGTTVYNRATVAGNYLANGELLVGGSPSAPTFEDQPDSILWTWENAPAVVLGSLAITPSAAGATAVTIDPTVVQSSMTVTPAAATATAVTIDPTVTAGGAVVVAPDPAEADTATVDPTVILGSVSITPAVAEATAVTVDPTVVLGALTITPAAAEADTATVDPTVVLSSIIVAPGAAEATAVTVDPTVDAGGNVSITPDPAAAGTETTGPTVVLSSLAIAPDPARASALTIDPAVVAGALIISPTAADATAVTIDPTVDISGGGATITPDPATAGTATIDPTVILGSLIIVVAAATASAVTVDPTVEIETPGATTTGNPRGGMLGPRTGPRVGGRTGPRTGARWRSR